MAKKQSNSNVKQYALITVLIAAVTFSFSAVTTYLAYPTAEHRAIGQKIATLESQSFSLTNPDPSVTKTEEYKDLSATVENTYSTRMALGSAFLSVLIAISIVVALYRYLRRNNITQKPILVTVVLNTIASTLLILPSVYATEWITGISIDATTMILLIVSLPFAIGFTVFFTFIIAKATERHYNRTNLV